MERSQVVAALGSVDFDQYQIVVALFQDEILFSTRGQLSSESDLRHLLGLDSEQAGNGWVHRARLSPLNAFILRYSLPRKGVKLSAKSAQELKDLADRVPMPTGKLSEDKKFVDLTLPAAKPYRELASKISANPGKEFYRLRVDRLMDLETSLSAWKSRLPKIALSRDVTEVTHAPIIGFDGTVESLKDIPIAELNIVKANIQGWKALKSSKATVAEKLEKHGISNLYELLYRLPRRYIDKSKPQLISDLIVGEKATLIGTIVGMVTVGTSVQGLRVTIQDNVGSKIPVMFWRQTWLKTKFSVGAEVIVNGTVSSWNGQVNLGGDSIEHFDEGVTLPVVPIYRQAVSAGITSAFLISAVKELLQRIGDVSLPTYFKNREREDMKTVLSELHFPTNLETHEKALLATAYYELVYLQLIIQSARDAISGRPGLRITEGRRKLQDKAIRSLPWELTPAQVKAIGEINRQLAGASPSTSLLLADVGSGKTLTAQLACLRTVDAGHQAVFVGPTEVLARQIYASTVKLCKGLEESSGERVRVELLSGTMKAAEKKETLQRLKAGEIDILVGTHAALGKNVKYSDLGLVVIDEQQKFGAEQRSILLESRDDGNVPDLLMQTATPIPRTTAQVFYGDVDIIAMDGKPAGRTPIVTSWVQEDPQVMLTEPLHPVWMDVLQEASKGNQTFVIAPMVVDSSKIDSASVERAYKELSTHTLKDVRVGFVHGSMKADEQRETMRRFRDRELDVLVASTVVEVGVDIPDATRVVILSADRLGASSLHQIRGRVGRSSKASKCYLVSLGSNENSQRRMQALVDSENGFEIAKIDLEIRGEGSIFSGSQSGGSDMIVARLATHSDLIQEATAEAKRILASSFRNVALKDAQAKFDSPERLF